MCAPVLSPSTKAPLSPTWRKTIRPRRALRELEVPLVAGGPCAVVTCYGGARASRPPSLVLASPAYLLRAPHI